MNKLVSHEKSGFNFQNGFTLKNKIYTAFKHENSESDFDDDHEGSPDVDKIIW